MISPLARAELMMQLDRDLFVLSNEEEPALPEPKKHKRTLSLLHGEVINSNDASPPESPTVKAAKIAHIVLSSDPETPK